MLDCNVFFAADVFLWVLGAFCLKKGARIGASSAYLRIHQRRETSPNRDFPKKVLELVKVLHFDPPWDESIISHPIGFFFSGKPSLEFWCSGTMLCNRWVRRSRPGLLELLGTVRCDRDQIR